MTFRSLFLASTAVAFPAMVNAQPVTGLYVSGGAGANFLQNEIITGAPGLSSKRSLTFDTGAAAQASIGWGYGNGLRAEVEGDFLTNHVSGVKGLSGPRRAGGYQQEYGGFINALYDFDLGLPIYPYLGLGAGGQILDAHNFNQSTPGFVFPHPGGSHSTGSFAYQGIAGAAYPLPWVPGLSLTAEYRMVGLLDPMSSMPLTVYSGSGATVVGRSHDKIENVFNHEALIGVRYAFGTAVPVPPAPVVAPVPAPAPARTYLVFFDWDRADLTDRARQIIAEAATASTHVAYTKIEVQGNADRSGTPQYNLGLSKRRAETVAAELVRRGVPRTVIDIEAFGDTRPLVPTAAGVREPQNRRVAIILR
jgi:outer membrane protein OmpA-like peptidoglycan-associated protein